MAYISTFEHVKIINFTYGFNFYQICNFSCTSKTTIDTLIFFDENNFSIEVIVVVRVDVVINCADLFASENPL